MVLAQRITGIVLLCITIAFVIAAAVDMKWVDQKDVQDTQGHYELGLQQWEILSNPLFGDSPKYDYTNAGSGPWVWNEPLMGSRSDWEQAGKAALGLGAIGVILAGVALLLLIVNIVKLSFTKMPAAVCAFVSGLAILLGAILYEGLRPSWGGDIGYNHPMGLYLGGGIAAEVTAILAWNADYIPPKDDSRI